MKQNIFLVGPASVGKSTTGKLLAQALGYRFVDIDLYFCDRIALISDYIRQHGYAAYCERDSELADKLVVEFPHSTVFATPSGFLIHEDSPHLVQKHLKLIGDNAQSVLLLPSSDPKTSVDMVVKRQLGRWPEMKADVQRERYIARHAKYKDYGDIKIIGTYPPEQVVKRIVRQLSLAD